MANHLEPTITSTYSDVLSKLDARLDDQAKMFDPLTVDSTVTNVATNAIQWDSASSSWKKYNGTNWVELASNYSINITGNAGTVDGKSVQSANFNQGGIMYASDATTISVSEAGGTTNIQGGYYLLKSNGTSAPGWIESNTLTVARADGVYTTAPPSPSFDNDYHVHFGSPPGIDQYKPVYFSSKLMFNSQTGDLTATGNVTAYSDSRLKTDLVQISNALEKVSQLTGYVYTRIDTGAKQTGLLADDVKKVLPEAVKDGEYLGLSYGNMMGLIVEAIKELKSEVEELKMKINP